MLALGEEDGKPGNSLKKEEVTSVVSILQSIRNSEDAVNTNMSKVHFISTPNVCGVWLCCISSIVN